MRLVLLGLASLAICSGTASACINDEESKSHEREFRSQYGAPLAPSRNDDVDRYRDATYGAAGTALVAGALVLALRKRPQV